MLIFGQRHLQTILAQYAAHYNGRRPHRSRQLRPPRPDHPPADLSKERIKRRPVLGGLINDTSEPHRRPGQDRWPSSGTPQVQTTFATQSEDLGGCPVSSKGDRSNRRSRSMASSPRVRCTERPVLAPPPCAISASPRRRHRARESSTSARGRPRSPRAGRSAASGPAMPGPLSPGAAEPPRPGRCVLPPRGVLLHGG